MRSVKVSVVGRTTPPCNSAFRIPHSALFRGLHPQTIVESIEVLRHPNDEGDFDDLSLIPRSPQSPVQRIGHLVARPVHDVGKVERRKPAGLEAVERPPIPPVLTRLDQLGARALLSRQDSMGAESVAT